MGLISRPRTSAHWYSAIRDHVNKHGLAVISLDVHVSADQVAIGHALCRLQDQHHVELGIALIRVRGRVIAACPGILADPHRLVTTRSRRNPRFEIWRRGHGPTRWHIPTRV